MVKVFVHTRTAGPGQWHNEAREFSRLPAVGEFFAMDSAATDIYRVVIVVHCPFSGV